MMFRGTNMGVTVTANPPCYNIQYTIYILYTIPWLYVVMSRVCWHAMQQIITSSLTATLHFPNEAKEHEKGWSSRSSNRVE